MNTIVLAVRGLPVGFLGCYGNEWVATPNLDRLAAQSVVFDQHFSDAPALAAACRAWRSGRRQTPGVLPPTTPPPDLIELLGGRGFTTVLVRHNREGNDAPPEFAAGWGQVRDARPVPGDRSPLDALVRALDAVDAETRGGPPWLLWAEVDRFVPPWDVPRDVFEAYAEGLFTDDEPTPDDENAQPKPLPPAEAVDPWTDPPDGWFDADDIASWELLHTTFAAAVTTFDADFGRLWKAFERLGWADAANVVVTADRGTPLGQHGLLGPHRPWMHEELVHLPLVVRLAGAAHAGRRVSALTQPPDLMPTLLEWHGVEPPPGVEGVSLVSLCEGRPAAPRDVFGGLAAGGFAEWYLRTPTRHLIVPGSGAAEDDEPREAMLFSKPDDRWEVNDLRPRLLDEAEPLEARLRALVPGITLPATPASR